MRVPGLRTFIAAAVNLHKTHTALDETPREQAVFPEVRRCRVIEAIHPPHALRLAAQVRAFGGAHLHAVRQFIRVQSRRECRLVRIRRRIFGVPLLQQIKPRTLLIRAHVFRRREVGNRFSTAAEGHALIRGGHEAVRPVQCPVHGCAEFVEQHDKGGQVFAFGAEAVGHPRAHARASGLDEAGVHLEERGAVVVALRVHAADHAQAVGMPRQIRINLRHVDSGLAVLRETIWALHGHVLRLAAHEGVLRFPNRDRLAVILRQRRFRIEEIDMRRSAIHEQEDHRLRFRREMRRARRERVRAAEHSIRAEQRLQRQPAESGSGLLKDVAASEGRLHSI